MKKEGLDVLPRLLAGVFAEVIMVAGYLFFEGVVLGLGAGAFATVLGNAVQALCGCVGATAVVSAFYPLPAARKIFPAMAIRL